MQPFFIIYGAATVPVKFITPRHAVVSIIIVHYIDISWCLLLQETYKGNEIHTRHHWPTIDPVNKKHVNIKWYVDA